MLIFGVRKTHYKCKFSSVILDAKSLKTHNHINPLTVIQYFYFC